MKTITVQVEVKVVANSKDEAEDFMDNLLEDVYYKGMGMKAVAECNGLSSDDVTRIYDWEFPLEE